MKLIPVVFNPHRSAEVILTDKRDRSSEEKDVDKTCAKDC